MISFGQAGIGPDRHYEGNRFEVVNVKCLESGGYVMENSKINSAQFASRDIKDVKPVNGDEVRLSFRTPFTGPFIPKTASDVVRLIRHRLILFVNEYGTGESIPVVDPEGEVTLRDVRCHILKRKSSRSEKDFFQGWTGSVYMGLSDASEQVRWLLACASILGMGPDAAFGAGFIDVLRPVEAET
jgi:hypothetical protein